MCVVTDALLRGARVRAGPTSSPLWAVGWGHVEACSACACALACGTTGVCVSARVPLVVLGCAEATSQHLHAPRSLYVCDTPFPACCLSWLCRFLQVPARARPALQQQDRGHEGEPGS